MLAAAWLREHLGPCAAVPTGCGRLRGRPRAGCSRYGPIPRCRRATSGAHLSRALDVEVRRAVREDARRGRRSVVATPSFAVAGMAIAAAVAVHSSRWPSRASAPGAACPSRAVAGGQLASGRDTHGRGDQASRGCNASRRQLRPPHRDGGPGLPGPRLVGVRDLDGTARQVVALAVKPSALLLQHNGTSAVVISGNALYAFAVPPERQRHTIARPLVLHGNTRGAFPDAGGDGSGGYSSSSHSRPDRFHRARDSDPDPAAARPPFRPRRRPPGPSPSAAVAPSLGPTAVPSGDACRTTPGPGVPTPAPRS